MRLLVALRNLQSPTQPDANHRYAKIEGSDLFNNHTTGFA